MHDDTTVDTLSNCEKFYLKFNAKNNKEVYVMFDRFKTNGVDMAKSIIC